MKRIPPYQKDDYGIKLIRPIFNWIECEKCKLEFKNEKIWKIFLRSITLSNLYEYLCQKCCPSLEDAILYRKNRRKELKNINYD